MVYLTPINIDNIIYPQSLEKWWTEYVKKYVYYRQKRTINKVDIETVKLKYG